MISPAETSPSTPATAGARAAYAATKKAIDEKLNPPPKPPEPFAYRMAGTMEPVLVNDSFVKKMLKNGDLSVVYGPSNSGKTFVVLDIARCVAMDIKVWNKLKVVKGGVLIVALEGTTGMRNRMAALRLTGRIDESVPMAIMTVPFNILAPGMGARLAATVNQFAEQLKFEVKLVIIDTLARAMAGANEDSSQDMGEVVEAADAIRGATGSHVMFVHHTGKNESAGARGSSALRAATGTEIEIKRPNNGTIGTVECKKQKELAYTETLSFSLEIIKLGEDEDGDEVTSCVINYEEGTPKSSKEIKAETLQGATILALTKAGSAGLNTTELRDAVDGSNADKDAARDALLALKMINVTKGQANVYRIGSVAPEKPADEPAAKAARSKC